MRIFITGGTGFIGKPLLELLVSNKMTMCLLLHPDDNYTNSNVSIIKGDLGCIESWQEKLIDFNPDILIHLAWEGLPNYGYEMSLKNLNQSLKLLKTITKTDCKKVIITGSCWEYGKKLGKLNEDLPPRPNNYFTAAKTSLFYLGKEIAKENFDFIWARLFFVYGENQRKTSLIPHIITSIKNDEKPDIKTPGNKNDFVYVNDVAKALFLILQKCSRDDIINIGSGESISVAHAANVVYRCLNQTHRIDESKSEIDFCANISKIKTLGWQPETDLETGIKKIINYFE